jgi:hypothetical protein
MRLASNVHKPTISPLKTFMAQPTQLDWESSSLYDTMQNINRCNGVKSYEERKFGVELEMMVKLAYL